MIIYHNPRCAKSREALALLEDNKCTFEIRNYLKEPPTISEITELIKKLKCKPLDIVRTKEPLFIEKFKGKNISDEKWIEILSKNPILIERPIVINGKKAIVGRPPSLIASIL